LHLCMQVHSHEYTLTARVFGAVAHDMSDVIFSSFCFFS